MSRAFVKEDDDAPEELAERPISSAPNLVTAEGFTAIEAEVARLTQALPIAEDRDARARINRDLRYWNARLGSAHVQPAPADHEIVRFGATVTIHRDDGREQTFRIVGEDEADVKAGKVSITSPLARAMIGKEEGDVVEVMAPGGAKSYEIVKVKYL